MNNENKPSKGLRFINRKLCLCGGEKQLAVYDVEEIIQILLSNSLMRIFNGKKDV